MAKQHGFIASPAPEATGETATPAPEAATVTVPANVWEQLQQRLANLEHQGRIHEEQLLGKAKILDPAYEEWKRLNSRPAQERSQDLADQKYGTEAPRFRVRLDSTTEDGKPGPIIDEHPALIISANSDLEAGARYLELCGIKKHDYKLRAEPVAA